MVLQIQGPAFRSPRQNPRQTTARAVGSEGSIVRFSKRRGSEPIWPGESLRGAAPLDCGQPCCRFLQAAMLASDQDRPSPLARSRRKPSAGKDGICQRSKPAGGVATLYGSKAACGKRQQGCQQSKGAAPTGPAPCIMGIIGIPGCAVFGGFSGIFAAFHALCRRHSCRIG
jgi:hypothetical protein